MSLPGYTDFPFTADGITHTVYQKGDASQPGVLLMHELPGMTPECLALAERLHNDGLTVYLPLFFGRPNTVAFVDYTLRVCISREFYLLASRQSSPITGWLRALCREIHARCGGRGVGAIGMCLTGGFALSLLVDASVMAPVLSQPSLPLGVTRGRQAELGLAPEELAAAQMRVEAENIPVLALRFTGDRLCPAARFDSLRAAFGDRLQTIEIDSSPGNPHGIAPGAHSVLAGEFVNDPAHPTYQAYAAVMHMLKRQLRGEWPGDL